MPWIEEIVVRFLDASGNPRQRGVLRRRRRRVGGQVRATNLPWRVSEAGLAAGLAIPRVRLLNDLEAAAYGVIAITDPASLTLQAGDPPAERRALALVSAGTASAWH